MLRTLFWLATIFKKEVKSGPGQRVSGNAGGAETAAAIREGVRYCECVTSDQANGSKGCLRLRQNKTNKENRRRWNLTIYTVAATVDDGQDNKRPAKGTALVLFSHTHTQTRGCHWSPC